MTGFRARRRALHAMAGAFAARWMRAGPAAAAQTTASAEPPAKYPRVVPGRPLRFPEDEGSHPEFRTEWWYVTGWITPEGGAAMGFQVTFFRTRPHADARNPSAFAPHQIMIAHAALSAASRGRLMSDQRIARTGFGLAGAAAGRTHAWIDDWSLSQHGGDYAVRVPARDFTLELTLGASQSPLLQGEHGYSRKGPRAESASYYYSLPHLAARGALTEGGRRRAVSGTAWLDHEWSSSYMDARAAGWDWIGINFEDGGALMAFRMRERGGSVLWAGGAYRSAGGERRALAPEDIEFIPTRWWRSPRTGARYPVAFRVQAGAIEVAIEPLMDDQEHDTRASVGTIYWEGAATAQIAGKAAGRGYLELTGYWRPMRL